MRAPLSAIEPATFGVSMRTRGDAASAASRVMIWPGALPGRPGACGVAPGTACGGAPVCGVDPGCCAGAPGGCCERSCACCCWICFCFSICGMPK